MGHRNSLWRTLIGNFGRRFGTLTKSFLQEGKAWAGYHLMEISNQWRFSQYSFVKNLYFYYWYFSSCQWYQPLFFVFLALIFFHLLLLGRVWRLIWVHDHELFSLDPSVWSCSCLILTLVWDFLVWGMWEEVEGSWFFNIFLLSQRCFRGWRVFYLGELLLGYRLNILSPLYHSLLPSMA